MKRKKFKPRISKIKWLIMKDLMKGNPSHYPTLHEAYLEVLDAEIFKNKKNIIIKYSDNTLECYKYKNKKIKKLIFVVDQYNVDVQ